MTTLFESLQSFGNCNSLDQLHAATAKIARQMGFEHFLYAARVYTSLTRPYQFIFSGYPKEWRSRYSEAGYEAIDPTIIHCTKEVIPVIWNKKMFNTRPAAKFWDEAKSCGIASGASFSLHGRKAEAAMLSLASSRDLRQAKADIVTALPSAQLLLCYLHEAIERIVLTKEALPLKTPHLTTREQECLRGAADGKTSWEISKILGVSERTVIFHVQNATTKLGVTSRQHAITRALSLGLIAR
jgi:DNA-binding CsgD family transcriptional regulator